MLSTIFSSSIVLLVLGILFGIMLGYFKSIFKVEENPKIELIFSCLPGANCGACGFAGCSQFAENLANNKAKIDGCRAGGEATLTALTKILEVDGSEHHHELITALAICQGGELETIKSSVPQVGLSCKQAHILKLDHKLCRYSCIGFGDCEIACPFDALKMSKNNLPVIDKIKCTSCGICVTTCPRNVLELIVNKNLIITLCRNQNSGSFVKQTCKIGCITCLACEKKCPQKAISMSNNIPVIDHKLCDLCGICVNVCPTKSIVYLERER